MSTIQMYEKILEYYTYEGSDYDYSIFTSRIVYTNIQVRLHRAASTIRVTMLDLLIYEGDYRKAPDLSPSNMLRELHRIHKVSLAKDKTKELYKLHVKCLKAYKDGYSFDNFRKMRQQDNHTYNFRERLVTVVEDDNLVTYSLVVYSVNNKVCGNIQIETLFLDIENKIVAHEVQETKTLIYKADAMDGLTHGQISDLFIKLDEGEDTIIMSRLISHFRKRTIDDFLSTINDEPSGEI